MLPKMVLLTWIGPLWSLGCPKLISVLFSNLQQDTRVAFQANTDRMLQEVPPKLILSQIIFKQN